MVGVARVRRHREPRVVSRREARVLRQRAVRLPVLQSISQSVSQSGQQSVTAQLQDLQWCVMRPPVLLSIKQKLGALDLVHWRSESIVFCLDCETAYPECIGAPNQTAIRETPVSFRHTFHCCEHIL